MTTPEPVSPAPDTEALRQQVAESIARDKERITSWNELSEWGQELYSQKAHELLSSSYVAGLRADLDRARDDAERVGRTASDLVEAVAQYKQNWYSARDANHRALETIARLENDLTFLARAGAHPIPDDAAAVEKAAIWLLRAKISRLAQDEPTRTARMWNMTLDQGDRDAWLWAARAMLADLGATPTTGPAPVDHLIWSVVHVPPGTTDPEDRDTPITPGWWVLGVDSEAPEHPVVQVHLGETLPPTTGPAPAAADVQWGVRRADGVLDQRDDEPDAREHLHWFDPGTARVVSRTVVYGPWLPAAPQDPAEPTASAKLFNRLIAGASVVNGVPQTPAAREDTAPSDDGLPPGQARMIQFAALRCADVDNLEWETLPAEDRDRYQGYVMAMLQVLPPHITGELWTYLDKRTASPDVVALHEAAREDAATNGWAGHHVQVSESPVHDNLAVAMCQDSDCTAHLSGSVRAVNDWADAHRADTLRPSAPTEEV